MLNPFYWYSAAWTGVLLLYSLNISDFCQPLVPSLLIFVIISIIVGFALGTFFKDIYNIKFENIKEHVSIKPTILFIALYFLNFLYARDIPLLDSLFGKGVTYKEFSGIPILGVAIMIFTEIYAVYLSMQWVCFKKTRFLIEMISIVMLSILQQSRHVILVCTIAIIVTYLKTHKVKLRVYVLSFGIAILFCYIVGGLGNIRHLSSWTDSSYIESLSRINDNYPKWLPKEFIWAYLYIVTPLANLNFNIKYRFVDPSFTKLLLTFMPNFIMKRVRSITLIKPKLIIGNFTASTAFSLPYQYGGWIGIILVQVFLLVELLIFTFIVYKQKSKKPNLAKVAIMFQLYFSSLTIFAEVFAFDGTIIPMIVLIIMLISPKIIFSYGSKKDINNIKQLKGENVKLDND